MGAPTPLARRRSGGITHQPAGLSITIFAAVAPLGRQPQRISISIPRARASSGANRKLIYVRVLATLRTGRWHPSREIGCLVGDRKKIHSM